jgi:hypothetical protein
MHGPAAVECMQVLREAKEKKEQDFADKWKQMKTGQ